MEIMHITMNDSRFIHVSQLRTFLEGSQQLDVSLDELDITAKYRFISATIHRLKYSKLSKRDKMVVIRYLQKLTHYKPAQLFRLLKRASMGKLIRKIYKRINPNRHYQAMDIKLLEKTDTLHLRLNTLATKEILRREVEVFGHHEFNTIAQVSPSHIHNLRDHPIYKNAWVNHTKARQIAIGSTKPPQSFARPGCIRVDSVHQREIYHINAVDEVTQWEIVIAVVQLTEPCLKLALQTLIDQFPFTIFAFHSDRGGEYINYTTAALLNKLFIEQTKSRSRHCNDNALVEGKNGSVIRKNFGWEPIHQSMVSDFNKYYLECFNVYLNYHRPCLYVQDIIIDSHGKTRKLYNEVMVPFDKLKQVSQEKKQTYLKAGVQWKELDKIAYQYSDNDFAQMMRKAEWQLFEKNEKMRT
jgi:transposase InsO family protein